MSSNIPENTKGEISLKEVVQKISSWLKYLNAKRLLISTAIILGGGLGLLAAFLITPQYTGKLTFVLENNGKNRGGVSSIAAQFGLSLGNTGGGVFQGDDNMIAFIKSRNIVVHALLSADPTTSGGKLLVDRYLSFNDFRSDWEKDPRLSKLKFEADPKNALELQDSLLNIFHSQILKAHLIVDQPDKKNDIIQIATTSPDPYFSKIFSEKLLENVTRFYIETQTKRSKENVQILRFQVDSIRNLLNIALSGAAVSNDANPNLNPAYQRLRVTSQKQLVDVEMNKAILEELVKQLGLAEVTLRKETPLVQVIDIPILPIKPEKLGKLKGIAIGMFLGGFLTVLGITLTRLYKRLIA